MFHDNVPRIVHFTHFLNLGHQGIWTFDNVCTLQFIQYQDYIVESEAYRCLLVYTAGTIRNTVPGIYICIYITHITLWYSNGSRRFSPRRFPPGLSPPGQLPTRSFATRAITHPALPPPPPPPRVHQIFLPGPFPPAEAKRRPRMSCFIEKWNPPLLTDTQTKYKVVKQASNRIFHSSIVHVFSWPVLLWGLTMGNPTATLYDNDSSRSKGKVVGNSPEILHCSTVLEIFNYT